MEMLVFVFSLSFFAVYRCFRCFLFENDCKNNNNVSSFNPKPRRNE